MTPGDGARRRQRRKVGHVNRARTVLCLVTRGCLSALAAAPAAAQGTPVTLPAADAPDTVRTNLWLVEALMGEVFHAALPGLPPAPARVRLAQLGAEPTDDVARGVAIHVLRGAGYEVFVAAEDSTAVPVECELAYRVQDVKLNYPATQRTLGLWRRSVSRSVAVTVAVDVTAEPSGQILFSERLRRSFEDRIDADDLDLVDSAVYPFTTAPLSESGWQRRTEELVVLGTLAGLVAVYFANTGD
jgi:hypothetical protein